MDINKTIKTVNFGLPILMLGLAILVFQYFIVFAVDFTDESYYVAVAQAFAKGLIPFVDEFNLTQMGSWVLTPFVWLYLKFQGSNQGIVLFSREVFFFLNFLTAFIVFKAMKEWLGYQLAVLVGVISFLFVYLNIANVSYNTVSSLAFRIHIVSLIALFKGRVITWSFLSGLSGAVAAFTYPPLAPAVLVSSLSVVPLFKKYPKGSFWPMLVGMIMVAAGYGYVLYYVSGVENVMNSIQTHFGMSIQQGGGLEKLQLLGNSFAEFIGKWWPVHIIAIVYIFITRWFRELLLGFPIIALLAFATTGMQTQMPYTYSTMFTIYIGLMSLIFFVIFWSEVDEYRQLTWLVLSIAVAQFLYAYASNNGWLNLALAGICMVILWPLLYAIAIRDQHYAFPKLGPSVFTTIFCLIFINFLFPVLSFNKVSTKDYLVHFRDSTYSRMTEKVESGPYSGLFTSPGKLVFLQSLTKSLGQVGQNMETILFFNNFPGGYLVANQRPMTNSLWTLEPYKQPRKPLFDYFNKSKAAPDVLVKVTGVPFFLGTQPTRYFYRHSPNDPLIKLAVKNYKAIVANDVFEIFVKK